MMTENQQPHNGFPINLFMEDRPSLVAGGGKVALRKILLLLDAGSQVAVVSPDVCKELGHLIEAGRVTHTVRRFKDHDVDGATIVYAATNSRGVNRQILDCCREKNILCCCVDGNWAESDFTTPAITRHNQLTVSVSSRGNDCRQSKMVKNSLSRHLRMMEEAHLVVVGTDHNCLSVEEREPYHLTGHRFERAGFMIMQLWGIHEFMILNTCNRVEVIAVVSEETAKNGILRHIMGFTNFKEDKFYLKTDKEAFEHLSLVTAGMLSQTPGENHITAQLKEALETAKQRGWAGNMTQEWISSALHVSKLIKNQVSPLLHNYEIEDLALRYLEAQGRDLANSTIMLLGAGVIGKGLVNDSLPKVGKVIWCYHVNKPETPKEWNGKVELCTFNDMKNRITEADIIISATDAPGHILHMAHAPFFNQERPIMVIDLGMPRNIDPELDDLSSDVTVVDLDGLKYWYRRELTDMNDILSRSRKIIADNQDLYEKIASSFKSGNAAE
ncbi:NAD(P)-dependent oxidoreductase [Pontiella sulfatireligans]|uniref:Glutamyl-tRNA reductase n=1 Tax=Pontiella sulfatireligans TaxID=2750658 RepID=A0A6C2UPY0_9BACT|nr:NAD(P)-dependent oxidoreductase [Pontiella sulfatireligans]VGO22352.1 Glutamyl-tRNA reductase [Pontiella sulfatireligans]